jgi:hypothetical protein
MRAIYNTPLPFNQVPPRIVIEMAKHAIYWLNAFPHPIGVSDSSLSPRTIITGQTVDFNRHCKYEFGQYVQTHEQHDNSMSPRTIGALAMRPTGNAQGNYYFFSLSTGRIINRAHATQLPMPDDVIKRVHALARRQKANPGLVFLGCNQVPEDVINEHANDDDDDDDNLMMMMMTITTVITTQPRTATMMTLMTMTQLRMATRITLMITPLNMNPTTHQVVEMMTSNHPQ